MPFDTTPTPLADERRQLLAQTLDILRRAQLMVAKLRNWTYGDAYALTKDGRIQYCAREAIAVAAGGEKDARHAAYRWMAAETPATIRQYAGAEIAALWDPGNSDIAGRMIEAANDTGGSRGHARVMGMFCRAIAKLEQQLA